jgi:hypothetical protein
MGRAENAIQVIVARASLMLTRKSGRSCGSAEDRHSAQTRPGRHKSTGEPLVFHHLPENGHTEAKSGNAMSAARHRRGPAQGRSNVMVGIETSDLHGIGRSCGSRGSQVSGEARLQHDKPCRKFRAHLRCSMRARLARRIVGRTEKCAALPQMSRDSRIRMARLCANHVYRRGGNAPTGDPGVVGLYMNTRGALHRNTALMECKSAARPKGETVHVTAVFRLRCGLRREFASANGERDVAQR